MLTPDQIEVLEKRAFAVREHCIRMATEGGCFLGASLSCTDLIVHMYEHVLHFDPADPRAEDRDVFLLSKGHDVPALYGNFAEIGVIERDRLANHLSIDDDIYWHPNRAIPGIEYYSGSLGHLLSVGMGMAVDLRMRGSERRVFVVLGDGELDEGSVWEAALVAGAKKLDNLVAIVDRNAFQANIRTEELIPLEPIEDKFRAFGWGTARCDGHDFAAMDETFTEVLARGGGPQVIVCDTVRGKGLPSIEARADRWFCNFTATEIEQLLAELRGEGRSDLTSETLIVR